MLKRLASDAAIYGISSMVGRLINYLLVPLHTGLALPEGYGILSIFYAWAAILNVLFTYGMETAYFRHVAKPGQNAQAVFDAALSSLLLSTLAFSGLLAAGAVPISGFLGYPGGERYVLWFALLIGADTLAVIPFARLRHEQRPVRFAAIRLANILTNVGLNVFFLVACPAIAEGRLLPALQPLVAAHYDPSLGLGYAFLANLLASAATLPLLWPAFRGFRFRLPASVLGPMYRYAGPLVFSGLFYTVNEVLDRLLLERWLPEGFYPGVSAEGAVGIYSACYKLAIFISLAVQAYKYAAEPFFFSRAGNRDSPRLLAASMTYFTVALAGMFLAICLNLSWIAPLFIRNQAYLAGLPVVPLLLMANIFLGIYYNLAFWFKLTDKTYYGALISGGGALVTLAANLLLIPLWGYMGSAVATLLCYGSMAAASYWMGKRYMDIPYPAARLVGYLLAASGLAWLGMQWEGAFWPGFFLKNILLLLFAGCALWIERRARKSAPAA